MICFNDKAFGFSHPNFTMTPTPLGQTCYHCEEEIIEGDKGFFRFLWLGYQNSGEGYYRPIHFECDLRLTMGSLEHQTCKCSCYGFENEEDETKSKRERAKEAAAYYFATDPLWKALGEKPDENS